MATSTIERGFALPDDTDLREPLLAFWRRRGLLLATTGAFALATVLLAVLLPPTYQSSATILIEQQEIPQELVRSTITSFADQRVQVISQRVMTTQNLLQIIERYDLYPDLRRSKPREALIKRMREDVGMGMIGADVIDPRSGRPTRANIAFNVSYESRSAELAFKVASELTSLYLNENISSRQKQAEQASSFLSDESTRLAADIATLETQLAQFKEKHAEQLPELTQLNLQVMERTDAEVRDVQNRIAAVDQQRLLMEAQLAQLSPTSAVYSDSGQRILTVEDRLKALRSQLAALSARYAPDHPEVLAARREVAGLEQQVKAEADANDLTRRLTDARSALAAARERYSAEHPDVVRAQHLVDAMQQALASAPRAPVAGAGKPDNPAYIQVKGQLDALIVEQQALRAQAAQLRAKLGDYENRLARSPEVEREYRGLLRDYENARSKYQETRAKQMEAQVSQNLEVERKGERFTLIEPPLPPQEPISPRRGLILGLGLVLSLVLGIAAALGADALRGTVRGPNDLRRLLEVPALAQLPSISTGAQRARARRNRLLAAAAAGLAVIVGLALVNWVVAPLDVIWIVLQRRFGI